MRNKYAIKSLSLILVMIMIITVCSTAYANNETSHTPSIGLNAFFEVGDDMKLTERTGTSHMSYVDDMRNSIEGSLAMNVLGLIYETGVEPDEAKYMEVLINIMKTYEMENAASISEQHQMDNLKAIEDYGMDVLDIGVGLIPSLKGVDKSTEQLGEWIKIAISGLETIAGNTYDWIEGISDLETIIQNYAKHDLFLALIEAEADGELKNAASTLRTTMTEAMKIKLDMYTDISEENFGEYTECFFEDVFFEALKLTDLYTTDSGFQGFVDLGVTAVQLWTAWDVGKEIGKFVGNIAVGAEDVINRVLEMKAVYDISEILEGKLTGIKQQFTDSYSEKTDAMAQNYITYGNYLISCRIRGEYCMYSMLAKDAGLYSYFGDETAQKAESVYNRLTTKLFDVKQSLDSVPDVLIVDVTSEPQYEAVNPNSEWYVYDINGQLYDNYTLRVYDKQSLLEMVLFYEVEDIDHTVTEYIVDNSKPLNLTLEEGFAYTFEFVDNNNPENTKLVTVGVTTDDQDLISMVDVETQFGNLATKDKTLLQIKTYAKVGDLDALTNTKAFHYGEDGYLESIDDEELSTSGTLTNKGTVLIEMDSKGRLIKMEADENSDVYYEYAEYKYNDRDQLVSSTVYDGGGGTTYYFYDAANRLIKEEESLGDMGSCTAEYTYEDNVLVQKTITTQYLGFGDSEPSVEEILYKLDEKGRIVEDNNTTRSQVTEYNYDYWPIVSFTTTNKSGYVSSGFQYNDCEGHSIFTDWLDDMEFFTDDKGVLVKITGLKNMVPYTYEFIYEQMTEATQEGAPPENHIYDTNEIAAMVKSYFAEDWKDGKLLVLLRSETDGIAHFSLKFDPDDPEEYPEGMSMPIAEIMVDMMTGEMFVDYESLTFLW